MGRKKKVTAVTLSIQDLITQPRQLARLPMMNKMTGYRVLISVLERLQGLWRIAKMPGQDRNGQLYLNFVTDDFEVIREKTSVYNEGDVKFRLRLSDIAFDNHYDEAREALASISCIKCFVPDRDNPGYFRTSSLMDIRGKMETDGRGKKRFVGTDFEVIVPRLTAENILDINLLGNYTRFLGYTAGRLRSSFSYPLYIYLSEEWRHHGTQFTIKMTDLRYRLGFVKDSDDPDRETRYEIWSQFCQKVLDQAQRELNALASEGGADFTFTYQGMLAGKPMPPRKRPDAVRFTILPTSVGELIQQENDMPASKSAAQKLMTDFFHLTKQQTSKFVHRVTPDVMPRFLAQLDAWRQEIERGQHADIINRPAWAYDKIDTFLKQQSTADLFATAEEAVAVEIKEQPAETANATEDVMKMWG